MPSSTICITYSNPEAVYYPGTNVNGVVHLELKEPIKARSLRIAVDGRAHTHWSITRSRTYRNTDGTSRTESYTVHYSGTVIYAEGNSVAWLSPKGGKELLNAGSYQFPFTFQLPLNCAPSYEGLYGYIRYMVKVELDRPWRFNKTDKRLFTVVPMFDLNMIPQAAMPIRESVVKNLGIVLFRHGKVSVQCDIPKTGFVPGETIVINAVVVNDSSKDIVKASTKLVEMSKYVAFRHGSTVGAGAFLEHEIGDTARQQRRKLATGEQNMQLRKTDFVVYFNEPSVVLARFLSEVIKCEKKVYKDICVEKKSKGTVQLYIQVPSTVPSFNCCPIISVEYVVEVKFKTQASFKGDIGTHCHVIVGTIPVRNPYMLAQPSAPPAQVAETSTSNYPSAPPIDQLPAYQETNGAGVHPPPPPSYEESVKGVGGTTMDTDEMEPFVPRYPFYPQLNVNAISEKPNSGDSTKT